VVRAEIMVNGGGSGSGSLGGGGGGNGGASSSKGMQGGIFAREDGASCQDPPGILREEGVTRARKWNTDIPNILPHERVFPIQIGSELFRLSGASISSDGMYGKGEKDGKGTKADKPRAPSYFSQFFQCQLQQAEDNGDDSNAIRTLYIDRDPGTFRDISLHLQGYHVMPRDGSHFVKLFADAQFYSRASPIPSHPGSN
jgi:hypothetical protein